VDTPVVALPLRWTRRHDRDERGDHAGIERIILGQNLLVRPFLDRHIFDPETTRLMGIAFEMARAALRAPHRAHLTDEAIAARIIELAKSGARNIDALCEAALNVTARVTPSSWKKDHAT
jgi:hypothetical protein